jgi:hypothetical protein
MHRHNSYNIDDRIFRFHIFYGFQYHNVHNQSYDQTLSFFLLTNKQINVTLFHQVNKFHFFFRNMAAL